MQAKRIEDAIRDALQGDAQANALDFVAHLAANGVPIGEAENYWDIQLEGQSVCFVWVDGASQAPGPWTIWSDQASGSWVAWAGADGAAHGDAPVDTHTKEIAWAHANPCGHCGGCDSPGKRAIILGRTFEGICNSALAFTGPDVEATGCAKKMVDARIDDIRRNTQNT